MRWILITATAYLLFISETLVTTTTELLTTVRLATTTTEVPGKACNYCCQVIVRVSGIYSRSREGGLLVNEFPIALSTTAQNVWDDIGTQYLISFKLRNGLRILKHAIDIN